MATYLLYMAAAMFLGLLTSISPCPLATNIAAISYVGRKVENPRGVLGAGGLYTLGRCVLYVALAVLLAGTAMSISTVSIFLQKYMHLALGPIFLVIGVVLAGLVTMSGGGTMMSPAMQKRVDAMGVWGALPLGVLFALSFCPTSAILYFGLLALVLGAEAEAAMVTGYLENVGLVLPEATLPGSVYILPLVYGLGTAVPVLLVAFLLAFSAQSVGKTYNILSKVEWWARQITGWVFLLLGAYFCLGVLFNAA